MPALARTLSKVAFAPGTLTKVDPPSVLTCHCTVGVGAPEAAAMNIAVCPAFTVWLDGFVMMVGAVPVPLPLKPVLSPATVGMKSTAYWQLAPADSTPTDALEASTSGQVVAESSVKPLVSNGLLLDAGMENCRSAFP